MIFLGIVDRAWGLQHRLEARFEELKTKERVAVPLRMFVALTMIGLYSMTGNIISYLDLLFFIIGAAIILVTVFFIDPETLWFRGKR